MPMQFATSDLLFTHLLTGNVGAAQAAWPEYWAGAEHATGWTRWLIVGRLAVARAEIALHAESPEAALEWADRALSITRGTMRRKYEARALELFGHALGRLGRRDDALAALRSAVEIADDLVGAPARWSSRSALGEVAYAIGEDDTAASAYSEAADLVEAFVPTLAPERAASVLAAAPVTEILTAAGRAPIA
jgi:tetratricopeptide (TPR) repeat protein